MKAAARATRIASNLAGTPWEKELKESLVLVYNRGECAEHYHRAFTPHGVEFHMVGTKNDSALPLNKALAGMGRLHTISDYMQGDEVLNVAEKLHKQTGKEVGVAMGYGLKSEDAPFHRQIEATKGLYVVGAASTVHELAGDKANSRDSAAKLTPNYNPNYRTLALYPQESFKKSEALIRSGVISLDPFNSPEMMHSVLFDDAALDPLQQQLLKQQLLRSFMQFQGQQTFIKSSGGGGGRGMHTIRPELTLESFLDFVNKVKLAQTLNHSIVIESAFPEGRHIEVQLLKNVAVGIRECTTQKGHQKQVEESVPKGKLAENVRFALMDHAEKYGTLVGNNNLGTVEYNVSPTGQIHFIEMNTRIQVEHPVTQLTVEEITGQPFSLPLSQLLLAKGASVEKVLSIQGVKEQHRDGLRKGGDKHFVHCRTYLLNRDKQFPGNPKLSAPAEGVAKSFTDADFKDADGVEINTGGIAPGVHNFVHSAPQVASVWGEKEAALRVHKQMNEVTGLPTDAPWMHEHVVPLLGTEGLTTNTIDRNEAKRLAELQQKQANTLSGNTATPSNVVTRSFSTLARQRSKHVEQFANSASSLSHSKV